MVWIKRSDQLKDALITSTRCTLHLFCSVLQTAVIIARLLVGVIVQLSWWTVQRKHASVLDSLVSTRQSATQWATLNVEWSVRTQMVDDLWLRALTSSVVTPVNDNQSGVVLSSASPIGMSVDLKKTFWTIFSSLYVYFEYFTQVEKNW